MGRAHRAEWSPGCLGPLPTVKGRARARRVSSRREAGGSGDEGWVGGCRDPGRPAWALPFLLPSLLPLPSPPLPTPRLPGSEASERAVGGRAAAAGRGGGLQSPSRKRRTHRPPRAQCVRALDPAMWGLLLALATFAPAVDVGLGAPSTSVLGLASPATTKAPVPTPRSSPAEPSAGKENGELPSYPRPASPANRLSHSSDSRVATPSPARAHTPHTRHTRRTLRLAPGWRPCPTRTHSLRGTMAADSAALVPGQTKSAVLGQEPVRCCLFQAQTFLFLRWGN